MLRLDIGNIECYTKGRWDWGWFIWLLGFLYQSYHCWINLSFGYFHWCVLEFQLAVIIKEHKPLVYWYTVLFLSFNSTFDVTGFKIFRKLRILQIFKRVWACGKPDILQFPYGYYTNYITGSTILNPCTLPRFWHRRLNSKADGVLIWVRVSQWERAILADG